MNAPKLIPELACSDIDRSLAFYTHVLGFGIVYARPEESFAYLNRGGAHLMLDQIGAGRTWSTADLAHPYGRGVNLQIEVPDIDLLYAAVQSAAATIFLPIEDKWYRRDDVLVGNRQFIVQDPDGYLLRFFGDLGQRPA
jgi:catechol 2,3-dioxygenase-like lactoylglutathione lyase family enzyme